MIRAEIVLNLQNAVPPPEGVSGYLLGSPLHESCQESESHRAEEW